MRDANYLRDTVANWQREACRADRMPPAQRSALRRELRQFARALRAAIESQLAGVGTLEPVVRDAAERERRRTAASSSAVSATLARFADADRVLLDRYDALLARIEQLIGTLNDYCACDAIESAGALRTAGYAVRPLQTRIDTCR